MEILNQAIYRNDLAAVTAFLQQHPDVIPINGAVNADPPLHQACQYNADTKIVSLLLARPEVNVNQRNRMRDSALIIAINKRHREAFKLLMSHPDIDVNQTDTFDQTPLMWAVKCDEIGMLSQLLAHPNIDINKTDDYGRTAYMTACMCSRKKCHRLLLSYHQQFQIACLFALVVFASDEMLELVSSSTDESETCRIWSNYGEYRELGVELKFSRDANDVAREVAAHQDAIRFFKVVTQLPMELQMLVCHRAFGSSEQNISASRSEDGFRRMAALYQKDTEYRLRIANIG